MLKCLDFAIGITHRPTATDSRRCREAEPDQRASKAIAARLQVTICKISEFNPQIDDVRRPCPFENDMAAYNCLADKADKERVFVGRIGRDRRCE